MDQLSPEVAVISGMEPIPEGFEDSLKIALMGSSDIGPLQAGDWQGKFCQGLVSMTCTEPNKGIIMYRGMKFLILNCKSGQYQNPNMTFDNPEFVKKVSADLDYAAAADAIFFNFLKRSEALMPLLEFAQQIQSNKMVVRCPNDYFQYGYVRTLCERYQVPLLPSAQTTAINVVQALWAYIPKLQEIQKNKLPE